MGRALAAAMQGMTLDADMNAANVSTEAAAGSSTSGSQKTAAVSALERRIPDREKLAEELGIGEITLTDIVRELEKPARDPREDMPPPDPAQRRAGYEGPKARHGVKGNRP